MKSKRWMPKIGENYWKIGFHAYFTTVKTSIVKCERTGSDDLDYVYNVFKTKKQATDALKKIKKILRCEE